MTDVLYNGELVNKNWLNIWLNSPEGKRIREEEKAQEKAAVEEERKKQQERQKQKRAEDRSKEKKVKEYFLKFRQEEVGGSDVQISDEYAQMLWIRARNAVEAERRDEEYRKQREEELRQMEESEKKRKEQRERDAIARRELPERQLQMFLSGKHDYTYREPGLKLLAEEFRTGKIIKRVVGQQAYNRLVEFAKPNETWEHLINRLLDGHS